MEPSELKYLFYWAVGPVVILLAYIYLRDRYHKEPLGLLAKIFFLGFVSAYPIVIVENFIAEFIDLIPFPALHAIAVGFIGAAIPEEFAKLYILKHWIWDNREFDEHYDGIVYAVFVSLGFACIENLMYVFGGLNSGVDTAQNIAYGRAIFSIPCHALCGVMMGYFFSLAKFERVNNKKYLSYALWVPVLFHGSYDAVLFLRDIEGMNEGVLGLLYLMFLAINVCLWVCSIKRIRHLASLLVPEGQEENALKVCAQCGNVYASNLKRCPNCRSKIIQVYESEPLQDPNLVIQTWESFETGEEHEE